MDLIVSGTLLLRRMNAQVTVYSPVSISLTKSAHFGLTLLLRKNQAAYFGGSGYGARSSSLILTNIDIEKGMLKRCYGGLCDDSSVSE